MAYTLFHGYGLIAHESFYIDYIENPPHSFRGGAPHRHNVGEFMLVSEGHAQIRMDSDSYQAEGKYLIYFPPYTVHRHINDMNYAFNRYCFSVSEGYFPSAVALPKNGFVRMLSEEEYRNLHIPVQILHQYFAGKNSEYTSIEEKRREHLFRLFLDEVAHLLTKDPGASSVQKMGYIEEVCRYLDDRIRTVCPLDALAAHFHVSRSKLTHDFRHRMKMSIGDYVAVIRLEYAQRLLIEGASVSFVARACGYTDDSNFIRFFKKNIGVSPAQFSLQRRLPFLERAEKEISSP